MLLSLPSLALILSFFSLVHAQDDGDVPPIVDSNLWQFRSRPDLYPPRLFVNTTSDTITPGYIFMAPYQSYQNSAVIYDSDGNVVWYGYGTTGSGNAHDFRVCQYNNSDHLCWTQGIQFLGYSRGQSVIYDTDLNPVHTVQSRNGLSAVDQHEFEIVGDSAMYIIYHPERYDLSAFGVSTGEGWVMNTIFQDVNLTTGELIFEWSPIEHVALTESFVLPNSTEVVGTGFSALSPWDYFHMNSVDKDADGNYLISSRHCNALYKINGTDGNIVWRLGGNASDYQLLNGLNFSSQHDARLLESNATTDIISLFDNASNGFQTSANQSAGYIIKVDQDAKTAELLKSFPAALGQPLSASQGNMQVLNTDDYLNSNVFASWGSQPIVTEHDQNGTIIYRAGVALDGKLNYRAYKFNITLTPTDSPALYSYALNTNGADTIYYMSWNGATEVRSWRVYGMSACDGNWTLLGDTVKTGFETNYTAPGYQEFGMVEAVAEDGTGIRNSSARGIKAFTPSAGLSASCNGDSCQPAYYYAPVAAQVAIDATRSACAALSVETVADTVSGSSSASASAGGSGSLGVTTTPSMITMASLGLLSTLLLFAVL